MKKNIVYSISSFFIDLVYEVYYRRKQKKFLSKLNKLFKISIAFDVGAHHGETLDMFLEIFPEIQKIYAFEPYSKSFNILKKKFSTNKKVYLNNLAISDTKKKTILKISNIEDGQSTLNEVNENSSWLRIKKIFMGSANIYSHTEEVEVDTLDNLYKSEIDLLKIDTEGNELKVLNSAENLIKNTKFILLEIHKSKMFIGYNHEKIYEFMTKNNFIILNEFKFPMMMWSDVIFYNSNIVDIKKLDF